MTENEKGQEEAANEIYKYAANLLIEEKKTPKTVEAILMKQGLDAESAKAVVGHLSEQIEGAEKARAKKDMLWGAVWAIGGTIATVADIGYIFWGAIIFGLFQFGRGVMNAS